MFPIILMVVCMIANVPCSCRVLAQQQQEGESTACTPLDAGSYYSGPVSPSNPSTCLPCPAGMFCPEGMLSPFECLPGTFQRSQGQAGCLPCPVNYQCIQNGTIAPVQCAEGRTNPFGSASACGDCNYDTHYYSLGANICVARKVPPCNEETHYEAPTARNRTQERECVPLSRCRVDVRLKDQSPIMGGPVGVDTFDPLQEYILVMNTRYTDRVCWAWNPCGYNDFVEQMPVDDGKGFLVKPLVCKELSMGRASPPPQYKLVDGSFTRDRDNVWVDCTDCSSYGSGARYQASQCTESEDAVCKEYTLCNPATEYVARKGGWNSDTLCASRTRCTASSSRSMYQRYPAVDSTSPSMNGTDAVCAPYSSCSKGHFMASAGNDTHDVTCTPCPPGTYRHDDGTSTNVSGSVYISCQACPAGTYSSVFGGTECHRCTDCSTAGNNQSVSMKNQCPFEPASEYCVPAAMSPCLPESDAVCTMCPTLSSIGGFSLWDEKGQVMCKACKPGYIYNKSEPVEGKRCVPCPPGFFCPSRDLAYLCPGSITLDPMGGAGAAMVPWSSPGAWKVDQCSCSSPEVGGGFEAPSFGFTSFGCTACPNGTYASPGMTACDKCPPGTYAAQTTVTRAVPSSTEIHAAIYAGGSGLWQGAQTLGPILRGAVQCTECPWDRPYTWTQGSESAEPSMASDCHQCPEGHFMSQGRWSGSVGGGCRACSQPCNYPYEYESSPCTELSDRQCSVCALGQCDPVTEISLDLQGCPGPVDPGRACAPCEGKPANSLYVIAGDDAKLTSQPCTWRCLLGYFYSQDQGACVACTELGSEQCMPGFIFQPCSAETNEDSSCFQVMPSGA